MLSLLGITLALIMDQVSKYFVENGMTYFQRIDLIGELFGLRYVRNTGVAFGLFKNQEPWLLAFVAIGIAAMIVIVSNAHSSKLSGWESFLIGLIVGGALGNNLIDRLRLGHVVDFFELKGFPAIFNFADLCIVFGAALLTLSVYRREKRASRDNSLQP
ncbi:MULTISPECIES: signal peptidase II [Mesotoga]|uniref:signal peptidase II n=1 Tax=Mesotoga TaxID=1184396 RepID=UPI0002C90C69|nr:MULTISPECIES: signal peptidase II [Mesotoga]MCP5457932.1 signal peptidase II [Thermotogota bacterium]CCU85902.1 Lipoprotein signal peptidase [Mesotoga infera]RLL87719.1 lipoprotein signal peptidase [Mesotoga sp. H07pep.5.4]HNQ69908.1 signal peptidase II [Mesotoga prima]HNS75419.1 signal peptidase II [Mesotoga prima]